MKRLWDLASLAAAGLAGFCAFGTASASDGAASAFDLLFRSDLKLPARTVLLTAREEGWRSEYWFASDDSGGPEIAICIERGPIILPAGKEVMLRVTSVDVIHTLSIPELGVTIDAIPGRLNEKDHEAGEGRAPCCAGNYREGGQNEPQDPGSDYSRARGLRILGREGFADAVLYGRIKEYVIFVADGSVLRRITKMEPISSLHLCVFARN
ncbi:hypothetical protein [Labrys sp. 22185]|uniref:hypothetical protein n=1 Tax=Labrys sp. 22185 TaxID=3453888 RepID=UPI003F87EBE3